MIEKIKKWKPSDWLLAVFVIWSCVGFIKLGWKLGVSDVEAWGLPGPLAAFLAACFRHGDFVFILLAFANVYAACIHRIGLARTRFSALVILVGSAVLEYVGTKTGYPFGAYTYTGNFGPRILGVLPVAIPLAWFVVVGGAYQLLSQYLPSWSRTRLALGVALFAFLFDWWMEPFAWKVRIYWFWHAESVPWANYATWFVASFLFARFCPLHSAPSIRRDVRPWWVLGSMLLTFTVGRLAYGV